MTDPVRISKPAAPVDRARQLKAAMTFRERCITAKGRALRLWGNAIKGVGYLYHAVAPWKRWHMPSTVQPCLRTAAARSTASEVRIPRIVWQTNFTASCSLPMWVNYRHNLRLSRNYEYRFVSTEERLAYVQAHASDRVVNAYLRLTDGAAQADLWRLVVLYYEGGVYMDIDATLLRPLDALLANRDTFFLWDRRHFSNFFLAAVPHHPLFASFIHRVVANIETYPAADGPSVFNTTGPGALTPILEPLPIDYVPRQIACLQGVYTNEHFQYVDRPRSKWIYAKTFISPP